MKQILIRHDESIDEETALRCAYSALKNSPWRTGIVTFANDIVLVYSDRAKYTSMSLYREKQDNGLKSVTTIIDEK